MAREGGAWSGVCSAVSKGPASDKAFFRDLCYGRRTYIPCLSYTGRFTKSFAPVYFCSPRQGLVWGRQEHWAPTSILRTFWNLDQGL